MLGTPASQHFSQKMLIFCGICAIAPCSALCSHACDILRSACEGSRSKMCAQLADPSVEAIAVHTAQFRLMASKRKVHTWRASHPAKKLRSGLRSRSNA